jgi:inorganic pyrophosphatase
VTEYDGVCIGVMRRRDRDDKLVVIPNGVEYTEKQILALTEFIERFHDSYLVR